VEAESDSLHIVIIYATSGGFFGMTRASGIAARRAGMKFHQWPAGRGSDLAVVPEIDHRVGEGLERVVQPADGFCQRSRQQV
jgi:hypothetical protein